MGVKGRTIAELAVLGVLGLALTLPPWITGELVTVTGSTPISVAGNAAAPAAATTAGIMLIAAFALTTAQRRTARTVAVAVGVIALLGAGAAVLAILNAEAVLLRAADGSGELAGPVSVSVAAYVCAAVLGAGVGIAVLIFIGAPKWSDARTRFEAAGSHPADPRTQAMDDWDALSAGDDPTGETGSLGSNRRSS